MRILKRCKQQTSTVFHFSVLRDTSHATTVQPRKFHIFLSPSSSFSVKSSLLSNDQMKIDVTLSLLLGVSLITKTTLSECHLRRIS